MYKFIPLFSSLFSTNNFFVSRQMFRSFLHLHHYVLRVTFSAYGNSPRHLRLRPTSNDLDIRDFHPYFIILHFKKIFLSPDMGVIVERSPSAQVPYDLRDTLGCFVAWTVIVSSLLLNPSYSGFPYIVASSFRHYLQLNSF